MNKKVTLSLLSATVFASMAASAFAAPTQGVYMGGSVDKFYKLDDLFNLSAAAKKQFVVDMNAANPDLDFKNLVFVDFDGKGAKFSEILAAGTLPKAKRDLTKADFEGSYVTVNLDGSNGVSYDPRNDAVDVPTGDLKVESVSAINLKSFTFKLSEAVDADTVVASTTAAGSDTVKVQNASGALVNISATVSEDGKTITVVNTGGTFTQLQNLTLKIDGVKSEDGSKTLTGFSQAVQVKDVTAPEVVSAVATSPKTVEISFSEPVSGLTNTTKVWDEFYIDGIKVYGTLDVSKLATSNKVTLTLGTALTVGDHSLKVTGLSDYANFPAADKTVTISVVADTEAPSIASAKLLTPTSAEIAFNEPVDNASVQAIVGTTNFKIENQNITSATPKADGKTYTIVWGTALDKGALVEVVISYKGVKDNYGNAVAETKTFKFTASDDTTAPTVTGVSVNTDNTLEVTFSEDVTGFTGADLELYDKDNKKLGNTISVAGKVVGGVTSKKVYTVTITGANSLSGAHTLKVLKDGVSDVSVRGNKNAEQTFSISFNDKVAPQVSKAEFVNETTGVDFNSDSDVKDSKITIFFNEAMDASTLTNKANYLLGSMPLSEVAGASLAASADNKSVTITINKGASDTQVTFANNTDLRVLAVKDAAGNTLDTAHLNHNLGSGDLGLISGFVSSPAVTTAVSKVEAIAKNQLKVYAATGYTFASIDPNKIKFNENQDASALIPGLQVMAVSIAADGKTAVLTLNNNLSADRKYDGTDSDSIANIVSLYADANAFELGNGAKTAALAETNAIVAVDKIAPSLVPVDGKLDATGKNVEVNFDETLSVSNIAAAQAFTVKDSEGRILVPGTDYSAVVSGTKVTLSVNATDFNDYVTVTFSNNSVVKDLAGNLAADFGAITTDEKVVNATPAIQYGSNLAAQYDGLAITNLSATVDTSVTKVEVYKGTEKLVEKTLNNDTSYTDSVVGVSAGDTLTFKFFVGTEEVQSTNVVVTAP